MVESAPVKLVELLNGLGGYSLSGDASVDVSSLSYDSRTVTPGSLFFCVPGLKRDGHEFAGDAVRKGATALCVQRFLSLPVTQVLVDDVRAAMAKLAVAFFGDPSRRLRLAGVTGTNGKTTTAYLVRWLLERQGVQTGMLSTVERIVGGERHSADRTTPEALDLQRDLAAMVKAGDRAAVMEVSSHALELGRADGLHFSAVAFTNLTQDHLDFHGSFEAYKNAKLRLFTDEVFAREVPTAVVNLDDPVGREIASTVDPGRLVTFSVAEDPSLGFQPDLRIEGLTVDAAGIRGRLIVRDADSLELRSPLLGRFNASNVLTALGLGMGLGLNMRLMLEAVASFPGVPGRMQVVEAGQPFTVAVDYAHTPDSVENVLRTARALGTGRIIAVLGCGGDRDKTKRPLMGRALEEGSDLPILTSDNPRSEDPAAIVADMLAGLVCPERAVVEVDRRAAITKALGSARPGDVVLILGKGHESGQEFADHKIPFDDYEVALSILQDGEQA